MTARGVDPRELARLGIMAGTGVAPALAAPIGAGQLVSFPAAFMPPSGAREFFALGHDESAVVGLLELGAAGATWDVAPGFVGVLRGVAFYMTNATPDAIVIGQVCANGVPLPGLDNLRVFPNGAVGVVELAPFTRIPAGTTLTGRVRNDGGTVHRVGVSFYGWQWSAALGAAGDLGAR